MWLNQDSLARSLTYATSTPKVPSTYIHPFPSPEPPKNILLLIWERIAKNILQVILDPLGRWSIIPETCPDWTLEVGGRPGEQGGRPVPEPSRLPVRSCGLWSLLDDRKLRGTLISLCKPDVWAFPPYFLITSYRNRQTPKLMEFCQIKP